MMPESLGRGQPLRRGLGVKAVKHPQVLEHLATFRRETGRHPHELPSAMAQTKSQDRLGLWADVTRKRIAHWDRRGQVRGALPQHRGEILAGVLPAG